MIDFSWRVALSEDERKHVDELIAHAADVDAEAGFSTAVPDAPPAGAVHHLLVSIAPPGARGDPTLDRLPHVPVVAYLRLDVVDGTAESQFVVRPEFRSRGVATLLMERLAAGPAGWGAVPGLQEVGGWAHGDHPATDRLARRFGARLDQAVMRTIRPLAGRSLVDLDSDVVPGGTGVVPEPVPGHRTAMAPGHRDPQLRATSRITLPGGGAVLVGTPLPGSVDGLAALAVDPVGVSAGDLRKLLVHGLFEAGSAGAKAVQLYVDALQEDLVRVSRGLGFEHDQSDLHHRFTIDP